MRDRRAARRGARRTAELRRRRRGPARRGAHSPLGGRTAAERYHGGALIALELQICARWVIGGGSPLSARLLLTGRGGSAASTAADGASTRSRRLYAGSRARTPAAAHLLPASADWRQQGGGGPEVSFLGPRQPWQAVDPVMAR
jgi:hypothetical protein